MFSRDAAYCKYPSNKQHRLYQTLQMCLQALSAPLFFSHVMYILFLAHQINFSAFSLVSTKLILLVIFSLFKTKFVDLVGQTKT